MPRSDLPLDQLRQYRCRTSEPADLDGFWRRTLAEQNHPLDVRTTPVDTGLTLVETFDLTFAGYGGAPIRAWLHLPAQRSGRLPVVVQFHGYSGGRGLAHEMSPWPLAGYAHLTVDTRGQGWTRGGLELTPDPEPADPHAPGVMTAGVLSPESYVYRRIFVDAVRAVQSAATLDAVDPERIVVTGASQGGGISIAVAALTPLVGIELRGAMVDIPFLCDFPRSLDLATAGPYLEIEAYLATFRGREDAVLDTVNHVDGVHLARRASCPTLFSVALRDAVCPPSTVFAAFAEWAGADKQIEVYPFNDHEGGGAYHQRRQLDWLSGRL